jgi:IS1 family transposase/transposase-like protein
MGCEISQHANEKEAPGVEDDHPRLWCHNPECPDFEREDGDNLRPGRRYGKQPHQRLIRCRTCRKTFSLRRDTPFFDLKMPEETFIQTVTCLGEGCGVRKTARILGLKPDTVNDVADRMGRHVERLLNHDLRDLWPNEVQLDELWSFVRKKEGHLTGLEALEREWGDCWVWVAFDPESKVVLGFVLGKRTKDRAVRLLKRVHEVLGAGCFPLFTSDELSSYEDALVQVFGMTIHPKRKGEVGRFPNPIRVPHPKLKYAVVHKEREGHQVKKVTRRVVLGDAEEIAKVIAKSTVSKKVNTSYIERENGKLRVDNGRLTRKTHGFPKERRMLRRSLALSIGYDHYCRPHKGLRQRGVGRPRKRGGPWVKRSPMMALGRADRILSVEELCLRRVPGRNVRCYFGSG